MTSGSNGRIVSWVAVGLTTVVLFGSIAVGYSDLNSALTSLRTYQGSVNSKLVELDEYDVYLTEKMDEVRGKAIRTEERVSGLQRSIDKLDLTMDKILNELKRMNEIQIRRGA